MKIIVENIAREITRHILKKYFSRYGVVEHVILSEYNDIYGASAIISMPEEKQAFEAIDELDGKIVAGREISVFPSSAVFN
ncbi:MAG: RNA-binding protein [Melioribacteraceae bacterium]|nr:RNA-binding protein [Melioribacteraceae bacterium]